jgi:acyl carrier protein
MTEEIRQFIIDSLVAMAFADGAVTGESSLGPAGLDLDSLAIAEIVVRIDDVYKVKIDEDESERFALMTIDEIATEVALRHEQMTKAS